MLVILEHFGNVSLTHLSLSWPGAVLWGASSTPGHSHGTVALQRMWSPLMKNGLNIAAEAAAQITPVLIQHLHPAPQQAIALSWSQPCHHSIPTGCALPHWSPAQSRHTFTVPGAGAGSCMGTSPAMALASARTASARWAWGGCPRVKDHPRMSQQWQP